MRGVDLEHVLDTLQLDDKVRIHRAFWRNGPLNAACRSSRALRQCAPRSDRTGPASKPSWQLLTPCVYLSWLGTQHFAPTDFYTRVDGQRGKTSKVTIIYNLV